MEEKKICWCCIAATPDYIAPCKRFKERMEYLGSKYPVEILITDNIQAEDLRILNGINYRIIPFLSFKNHLRYDCTVNKISCWNLTDYDYVCFIETDTFIFDNIDFFIDENLDKLQNAGEAVYLDEYYNLKLKVNAPNTLIFLVRPSKDFYNKIYQFYLSLQKDDFVVDNDFLGSFYTQINTNKYILGDRSLLRQKFNSAIIHMAGPLKWWNFEFIPEGYNLFNKWPVDVYNEYIDKNRELFKIYSKAFFISYIIPGQNFGKEKWDTIIKLSEDLIQNCNYMKELEAK